MGSSGLTQKGLMRISIGYGRCGLRDLLNKTLVHMHCPTAVTMMDRIISYLIYASLYSLVTTSLFFSHVRNAPALGQTPFENHYDGLY